MELSNLGLSENQKTIISQMLEKRYGDGYEDGYNEKKRNNKTILLELISELVYGEHLKIGDIVFHCNYCYRIIAEQDIFFVAEPINQENIGLHSFFKDEWFKKVDL